jgi:hypothetical protein
VVVSKRERSKGLGSRVRCKNWSCAGCLPWLQAVWKQNLWDRLVACPCPVHVWRGTEAGFQAARERVARWARANRAEALYCRVRVGDDVLVATNATIGGAVAATPLNAAEAVAAAINATLLGAKRPVSACHAWKLPDRRTGEFVIAGRPHDLEEANRVLLALGVTVVGSEPARGGAVEQRFVYGFPTDWDELAVTYAMTWAAAMTVPPGFEAGDMPPDPDALLGPLLRGETGDPLDWWPFEPAEAPPVHQPAPLPSRPPELARSEQALLRFDADVG